MSVCAFGFSGGAALVRVSDGTMVPPSRHTSRCLRLFRGHSSSLCSDLIDDVSGCRRLAGICAALELRCCRNHREALSSDAVTQLSYACRRLGESDNVREDM